MEAGNELKAESQYFIYGIKPQGKETGNVFSTEVETAVPIGRSKPGI